MQYRTLGKTGLSVSVLGFGTMRLPTLDGQEMGSALHEEESIRLLRRAIDCGVNYIDTAYPYHGGNAEILVGKALADGYRERVYLADKCPIWLLEKPEDFERILDEQLHKCRTDHFDLYLLHSISANTFESKVKDMGLIERMQRAQKAGKISHIGFSFHDQLPVFQRVLEYTDAWEFCQIQLNYAGTEYQAGLEGLRMAAQRGLGVVVMEPLLGGKLARLTPKMAACISEEKTPVQWALDWLWNLPEVGALLSGMGTMEQLEQNLAWAEQSRAGCLTERELEMLEQVRQAYLEETLIPCTQCAYCMPCPNGLDIPALFEAYNSVVGSTPAVAARRYAQIAVHASACVQCGACETHCPQQLTIRRHLKTVEDFFGS